MAFSVIPFSGIISVIAASNEKIIYDFFINTMNQNSAIACGVLANIEKESSFNPKDKTVDTNGNTSYGICQWNGNRFTELKNYCSKNGLDYTTLDAQLKYLKSELEGSENDKWKKVIANKANTAEGAGAAAYDWARHFERCAEVYKGVNQWNQRKELAINTYWPKYNKVMPTVTLKAESSITKTSAVVNFVINNPSKLLITASGVQIRKKGNTDWQNPFNEDISAKTEFNKNASIPGKFTIGSGKEVNFALSEGTTYEYRCYATYNGTKYYSSVKTFTTSGTPAVQTYTVKYNANGGSNAPADQVKTQGKSLTLSSTVPQKSGYDFLGWSTTANGSVAYKAESTYTSDAAVTLYAVWETHVHSYTPKETNAATCTTEGVMTYTCSCGHSYTKQISVTDHADGDNDGFCDNCNVSVAACSCICHSTGFNHFLYIIVRFFWMIMGTNKVCVCGEIHY